MDKGEANADLLGMIYVLEAIDHLLYTTIHLHFTRLTFPTSSTFHFTFSSFSFINLSSSLLLLDDTITIHPPHQ
jgi:hypothetical protein